MIFRSGKPKKSSTPSSTLRSRRLSGLSSSVRNTKYKTYTFKFSLGTFGGANFSVDDDLEELEDADDVSMGTSSKKKKEENDEFDFA
jgi:hypothetical protein